MPRKPATDKPDMTFEEARAKLREATTRLEQGELPLEEAVRIYEEGMRMYAMCNTLLDQAELRIQVVQANQDGTTIRQDIDIETE